MTKILVVDDEPDVDRLMRQTLRRRLRSGDLELLSARSGVEALALLDDHGDVEIALCDLNMPRMDGFVLLERLRERHPSVRAVMISANGDPASVASARVRGAVDFLVKPLDLRALVAVIERLASPQEGLA